MTDRERDERIRALVKRDSAARRFIDERDRDRWTTEELMRRFVEIERIKEEQR